MDPKNAAGQERAALMTALASQQHIITSQQTLLNKVWAGLEMIAHYAGLSEKLADINNPASPVADPASAPAPETTEQALESAGHDNVENLGATPGVNSGVGAEMTTTPMTPGASLPTQPFNDLIDVTAPTSGTETHVPNEQTRIETDVRVGNPDNPQVAFPWGLGGNSASDVDVSKRPVHGNRTFASLKLAKLRMIAGVESGEELEIAGRIEANASLSDELIDHEIAVLSSIKPVASRPAPRNLVPRTASADERINPSLAGSLGQIVGSVSAADTEDADLFD